MNTNIMGAEHLPFANHTGYWFAYTLLTYPVADVNWIMTTQQRNYALPGKIDSFTVNEIWNVREEYLDEFRDFQGELTNEPGKWSLFRIMEAKGYGDVVEAVAKVDGGLPIPNRLSAIISTLRAKFKDVDIDQIPRLCTGNVTPGAFFKGTKFRTAGMRYGREGYDPMQIYEAQYVIRNGADSYCVVTTTPSDLTEWYSVNISHVTEIVSQPKRRVYGAEPKKSNPPHQYDNKYRWGRSALQIHEFVERIAPKGGVVDFESMLGKMIRSGIFQPDIRYSYINDDGERRYYYHHGAPKRIKRWIKQNINRFLLNPAAEQARSDREDAEIMDRLDREERERDWKHVHIDPETNTQELGQYDPYDHGESDLGFGAGPHTRDDGEANDERFALEP